MNELTDSGTRRLHPVNAEPRLPFLARPYADKVDLRIAADDAMYSGNHDDTHYYLVGATGLNAVIAALSLARLAPPRTILDFGAGAGRVLRWLRAAFPDATLTACDLRAEDMAFCEMAFGAETFISGTDVAALASTKTYDLIWVGSVFTHLPPKSCAQLLDKLLAWCAPDGLLVFSTIGRLPSEQPNGERDYHYSHWQQIVRAFKSCGFGYADYDNSPGYGLALAKPSWYLRAIEKNQDIRLVMVGEAVWDNHHDVWAVQNRPVASIIEADYGTRSGNGISKTMDVNFFAKTVADRNRNLIGRLKTRILKSSL